MAFDRTAIPFFELANSAYVSASISFFGVDDSTHERLATLITLYTAKTGSTTVSNPYTLDSDGKFSAPVYAEARFIAVVTDEDGQQHTTGIWAPALSTADVAAAAASATAAATSETNAETAETNAETAATAAAASAALAGTLVGTVYAGATDTTTGRLITKLSVTGLATLTDVTTTVRVDVPIASNAQALAKASSAVALVPSNLAALNADSVTTGLMRFATAAEVTTGTVTSAAATPADVNTILGNTVTRVDLWAGNSFTAVTSAADVTMASGTRYRFTATAAAAVSHPTTVTATYVVIVEMAPTASGNTMTVKANGNTVDGVTTNDTYTAGAGPAFQYSGTAANTIRRRLVGRVPS